MRSRSSGGDQGRRSGKISGRHRQGVGKGHKGPPGRKSCCFVEISKHVV